MMRNWREVPINAGEYAGKTVGHVYAENVLQLYEMRNHADFYGDAVVQAVNAAIQHKEHVDPFSEF